MNYKTILQDLIDLSPRQGKNEVKTRKYLESFLSTNNTSYTLQKFKTSIPIQEKAILKANKKNIECKATSFVSGKIQTQNILSNLISSQQNIETSNVNFNPESDFLSCANFYFAPAVTIQKKDIPKILKAKKVTGEVKVKKYTYTSGNILVGNTKNPKNIAIAHYDSIETGCIDNASGVALLCTLITEKPHLLEQNLFVLSGNEELSYDFPVYWGHGFREFEKKNKNLFKKTENIFVVDCVGQTPPQFYTDKKLTQLAFPLATDAYLSKTKILAGEFDPLMNIYHSDGDTIQNIVPRYFNQAKQVLFKKL